MSKVVLVMDDPMNCEHCPLFHRVPGDAYCAMSTMPISNPDILRVMHRCPLKWMPKRSPEIRVTCSGQITINDVLNATEEGFYAGYNACIDALEGNK